MSLRVLLVDDDDRFRAAACRTLVAEGIEVVAEVDNGLEVLGAAARCRPDDINHSVFWPNMSPHGGDKPDGDLAAAIEEHFWSFDGFRRHFTTNALGMQGSG